MRLSRPLLTIGIVLVAASAATIAFSQVMGTRQHLVVQLVRLLLTGVLAFYLAARKPWARWVTVVLVGLGGVGSLLSFVGLFGTAWDAARGPMLWLLGMGILYSALAAYLAFSPRVSAEFRAPKPPGA